MTLSTLAAPVYGYACPKCEAAAGTWCVRLRNPEPLTSAHKERYGVLKAWQQNRQFCLDLPLYSVRKQAYIANN